MKSFLLALMLGFSLVASSQNKVIGTVLDQQSKPISGVTISMPELHKETVSDEKGIYNFNNLPNGNFKITFSFIGFETQTKAVDFQQKEIILNVVFLLFTFK